MFPGGDHAQEASESRKDPVRFWAALKKMNDLNPELFLVPSPLQNPISNGEKYPLRPFFGIFEQLACLSPLICLIRLYTLTPHEYLSS